MEAAEGEKATPMAVASANGVKKIFRARKTMTASCRQQIAILNKLKNPSKNETLVKESFVLPKENVQQQQTELALVTNCISQNTSSEMDSNPSQSPSNGFQTSAGVSPDDFRLKTGFSSERILPEWSRTCENLPSDVVTPVGSPANFSHIAHNVDNDGSTTERAQFNDVRPISSTPRDVERGEPIFNCDPLQEIKNCSLKTNIDNCSPFSEETSESSALRPINEDVFLKINSATGLVTPLDVLDTDSTNAAIPSNESNASCGTTGTSNFTMNLNLDSASHNLSQGCNITGDFQKRSFSGDADVPEAKRAKTSSKSLLDEIDCLIQRRIQTVFKESFDQRIQDLSQQINLIQCKEDNTKLLTRHIRSIKRFGRQIKYALQVQNEASTQSNKLPSVGSTCKELPKIVEENPPAEESSTSHTENNSMKHLSADCSSDNEAEKQNHHGQTQHSEKPSKKVDHSVIHKLMESIKEHRNRTLSSKMDKQPTTVIDLTDDEEQKDGDSKDATYSSPSHITSSSPAPVPEEVKDQNVLQMCSEKKEELSENKNKPLYDVASKTSSGLKSVSTNDLEKSTNPDPQLLKPPQKPELRLALVQNPKGIALSWNITHADPSCAPAQVYCLYVHQENPNNPKKLWKKIGEIKALPLPMACTLTQFVDDATYSFVLRAKDAFGRFGPLCDIQSTALKSLNTSKKT